MVSFNDENVVVIDNFLSSEVAEKVYNLINGDIRWNKMGYKNNNYEYSFSQNEDMDVINNILSVSNFLKSIEGLTGFSDFTVPVIFLSKYEMGDYLSPHNDNADDREYGFIYNVTKDVKIENGGVLHYINKQNEYDPILPIFNRLIMFKVEKSGKHFVSEVKKEGYKRQALTGWINTKEYYKIKKEHKKLI